MSTRMDPEDLREVITAYQKSVAETVRRSGGFACGVVIFKDREVAPVWVFVPITVPAHPRWVAP